MQLICRSRSKTLYIIAHFTERKLDLTLRTITTMVEIAEPKVSRHARDLAL